MTVKRPVISILIVTLVACAFYYVQTPFFSQYLFSDNQGLLFDSENTIPIDQVDVDPGFNNTEVIIAADGAASSSKKSSSQESTSNPVKYLEISGRVVDRRQQPIEDVLVTEERNFHSTRTDSQGLYKISVDLPEYIYPVLHFLREGFQGKRVNLKNNSVQDASKLEVDIELEDNINSISAEGWVGNDIGVGLGGLKIRVTSKNIQGLDKIHHTVFSDEKGNFYFEGLRSGDIYRLTVFSTEQYQYYVDEKLILTPSTPKINITLKSLEFVDIDGMIVNNSEIPIPNFEIYIRNVTTNTHVKKIVSDSSGFFSLKKFPAGSVSLTTQGPDYININGLRLAGNEYRNLNLVVDKGDHYLSGWVSDNNGLSVEKALVKLESETQNGSVVSSSYREKTTDSFGNFYFEGLGSGTHVISIKAPGFAKQEKIHHFESQSDRLDIVLFPIE